MSNELKACKVCGEPAYRIDNAYDGEPRAVCYNRQCWLYDKPFKFDAWNTRPIEDALNQRIAELEAKIKAFKNAELMNDIERIKSYNRIVYLEEQLRWRPVSEKPTESDFVLILYNGYRIPDTIYYDVEGGWLCADMPDYWRPIPELEVKHE